MSSLNRGEEKGRGPEKLIPGLSRFVRFGCAGLLVLLLDFSLVYCLGKFLVPVLAVSIAYFLAVCVHFCLHKWWVFGASTGRPLKELFTYALTATLCWCCTVACVKAALAWLTQDLLLAKMGAVPPTMVLGFCLMRLVVFQPARQKAI